MNNGCDCTQSNQYVLTQSQTSCIYMPPPTNCQAINYNDPIVGTPQVDITQDACLCYEYGVKYRLTIDDDTFEAYCTSTRKFKPYAPLASSANVKVEAFMYDIVSEENIYSVEENIYTPLPTPSPTFSNADIDWCEAIITKEINRWRIDITWSKGYKGRW